MDKIKIKWHPLIKKIIWKRLIRARYGIPQLNPKRHLDDLRTYMGVAIDYGLLWDIEISWSN